MSLLQKLKDSISEIRKVSSNFAEWSTTDFPEGKLEGNSLSAAEACALLEQIVQTIELALENEQHCIERISPGEMNLTASALSATVQHLQANQHNDYVKHLGTLIERTRPFAMLSMEKMDSKRYREIVDLEDILAKIRQRSASSVRAYRRVVDAEGKISELDNLISKNQELLNESNNMHTKMATLLEGLQGMHAAAAPQKEEIDRFSSQIHDREKDFASQKKATEEYEKKLESFSTERKELTQQAKELIELAKNAFHLGTAHGLGAAFKVKEEQSGHWGFKLAWLALGIGAAVVAICLGLVLSLVEAKLGSLLGRALVMFVAIGVAGFAGKQFAKNKAIEEDYAYKAALLASYPGFASKLEGDDLQKQYANNLLAEILQDPQRDRKTEKKKMVYLQKATSRELTWDILLARG